MRKIWRDTFRLLMINWDTLILFQISYKVLFLCIQTLAFFLFDSALKQAHLVYVTTENVLELLKHPFMIICSLGLLLLLGIFIYIEVLAVILYCQNGFVGKRLTVIHLYHLLWNYMKESFTWSHIALFLWLCLLIPLAQFPLNSVFTGGFQLPEFIMAFVSERMSLKLLYKGIVLFIFIVFIFWVFVPHLILLEQYSFRKAVIQSMKRVRYHFGKYVGYLLGWNFMLSFFIYLGYFFILMLFFLFQKHWGNVESFWSGAQRISTLYKFIRPILITAGNFSFITILYQPSCMHFTPFKRNAKKVGMMLVRMTSTFLICVFVASGFSSSFPLSQEMNKVQIIAHRGGGFYGPENTLLGIQMGMESQADYAEVDVQQTKDGVLVLSHDTSLERTTHVSKEIYNVAYAELQNYSIVNSEEKVPTLEEVLRTVKGRLKLMIELKPNGHEKDLEQKVIDLVKEYEMEKECIISSLNLEMLQTIKKLDPTIQTAYITAIAYGDLNHLEEVDYYAIETTFVTSKLIRQLHERGYKVFVWTVSEQNHVQKMLQAAVDGIITDDPYLVRREKQSMGMNFIVNYLVKQFS